MSALLFFDIDGTLITLDKKHEMPESTKRALYKAKEKGHKIFINTGRVKTAIDSHLLEFGFDGLVCGCGSYIEYEGKEIFHHTLTKEQCATYAQWLKECKFHTMFEGRDRLFIDGAHGPGSFLEYIYEYFSENSQYPIEEIDHPAFIFDKFTTCKFEESDGELFQKYFEKDFNLIPHTSNIIEAVPFGLSKATGIQYVMDYLKVPLENCYAFGDSVNDMEMLSFVKHSIGMGNAMQPVLDIVDYVTTSVLEDGIENALKHYELI